MDKVALVSVFTLLFYKIQILRQCRPSRSVFLAVGAQHGLYLRSERSEPEAILIFQSARQITFKG